MIIVQKTWGVEEIIENNDKYCLKVITCRGRKWSSGGVWHYHRVKDETFYVIEGKLDLDLELEDGILSSKHLRVGEFVRILPGRKHRFRSVGPVCRFIEASTHHSDDDTVRVIWEMTRHKEGRWVEK